MIKTLNKNTSQKDNYLIITSYTSNLLNYTSDNTFSYICYTSNYLLNYTSDSTYSYIYCTIIIQEIV